MVLRGNVGTIADLFSWAVVSNETVSDTSKSFRTDLFSWVVPPRHGRRRPQHATQGPGQPGGVRGVR